jgi:hypothetical protein
LPSADHLRITIQELEICNVIHGVIRADAFPRTRPFPPCLGSDHVPSATSACSGLPPTRGDSVRSEREPSGAVRGRHRSQASVCHRGAERVAPSLAVHRPLMGGRLRVWPLRRGGTVGLARAPRPRVGWARWRESCSVSGSGIGLWWWSMDFRCVVAGSSASPDGAPERVTRLRSDVKPPAKAEHA